MKKLLVATALLILASGAARAAEHTINMMNKGESGAMVFEPAAIAAMPGDTLRFVPTDKSHNVEGIKGMLPEGVKPFKSKVNEEYVLTVVEPGFYGVKCSPHYSMGMVALIQVGDGSPNLDTAKAVKLPKKANERMTAAFVTLAGAQ
ncbi:pseudoazurin [Sinorhizobium sp. RAC02]|uniref:pseudoazurin n=1 Tax=Sinorhizobium sp. RAC02 TaxID=1842534 RepID=UPI00083E5042|nr:pseudoazurin [Sinorhizobium sp. RAC02]AOF93911.1 pseudoazurin [Sinorhizobium sp. RAC02]